VSPTPSTRLDALRADAVTAAAELGLPRRGDEPWKYTSTSALVEGAFAPPTSNQPAPSAPERHVAGLMADLVFVNGTLVGHAEGDATALSEAPDHAAGALIDTLSDFRHTDRADGGGLRALNLANATDAALIDIPAGARRETPIYIQFHTSARTHLQVSPRVVIVVRKGALARVIEHHTGVGPCWNNAVTEIILEEGARLERVRIQEQDGGSFHTGATFVTQAAHSHLTSHDFACGARLSRSELHVRLQGAGAECHLRGLFLMDADRHGDQYTAIHHDAPHTHSTELYKGVLQDDARGVFTGRILVEPHVRGCTTRQENPNLLLSPKARVESRPQLEIRNNDVKAYHGATVGRLSPEAIFYLRSRGLDADHARRLLTAAFAAEIVDAVVTPTVRDHLGLWLDRALGGSRA
jgi:Fe-S cluster assembly protein SufD